MIIIQAIIFEDTASPERELTPEEKETVIFTRYINEQYEHYQIGDQLPQ
jgi:hypothetical protein